MTLKITDSQYGRISQRKLGFLLWLTLELSSLQQNALNI